MADPELFQASVHRYLEDLHATAADREGFTGIALEPELSQLVLYWAGPLPPAVAELISTPPLAASVLVRPAPYSLKTLDEEARRLIDRSAQGVGPKISVIAPKVDGSGLVVEFLRPSLSDADLADLARRLGATVPIEAKQGSPVVPMAGA